MNSQAAFRTRLPLALTAVSILLVVFARACLQSITVDEADTYLLWVARPNPSHWTPGSNNHILNSLLMRFFVSLFGPSNLTLRAPALIGAAIYITASYKLCAVLSSRLTVRLGVFLCLTANPFVLDHLVAARGYSLAIGFLMLSFAVAASARIQDGGSSWARLTRACAFVSACLALSFAANFSFGLVTAASLAAVFVWAYRGAATECGHRPAWRRITALAAWCVTPGLAVFLVLSASAVFTWPKNEFVFGARSVHEMLSSIVDASLFTVNPHLANPFLYAFLNSLRPFLVPLIIAAFVCHAVILVVFLRKTKPAGRRRIELAALTGGVVLVSVLVHWVAFRAFGLLLPLGRTGLYIASLGLLAIGITATVEPPARMARISRGFLMGAICVLAGYFLFCLRLTYFKEWYWNADSRHLYDVVAHVARANGARAVQANWKWVSALNYYRSISGENPFDEIVWVEKYSDDKKIYVLSFPFDEPFIKAQHLSVVYKESFADVAVAVRTEDAKPAESVKSPVPITATLRNLSRLGARDFFVGERFKVLVKGPPQQPVRLVAKRDSNASSTSAYGMTDAHGRFSITGWMGREHVGEWNEAWSVGSAGIPPIRFTVKPRTGA